MPSWQEFEPFIVSGLALGGVYALSGVGTVVLYQATGVVYLAFGAVCALRALVAWTQVIGLAAGIALVVVTTLFLRYTKLGTAMRAMANDREITATLGVPVRRVEAAAWLGCGVIAGVAGLLLADLVALDATTLTFLVISSLAAALIARLRSIVGTFVAAMAIRLIHDLLTPIQSLSSFPDMNPFVLAAVALLVLSRHRVIALSREEA